jgi:hypothetical protein
MPRLEASVNRTKSQVSHTFFTPTIIIIIPQQHCFALLCFLLHFLSTSIVECLNSVECNAAAAAQDHQTLFTCVNVYSK